MNQEIIGQLFGQFKDRYGSTVCNKMSVYEGQRDLHEFVMGIGRALEQQLFDQLGSGYQGTSVKLEKVLYRFKGNRTREVQGIFGKITLKRAYYVAGEGRTYCPLDVQLSILGHTPGLQYFLSQFTGQMVYERALEKFHQIFRPEGRDEISMRKALDMDYELGDGLEALRQQEMREVFQEELPIAKDTPIQETMAVCIDATKVRENLGRKPTRGRRKRYRIGFKDAKVATFSGVQWDKRRGEARCVNSSYVMAVEKADEFFQRIWVEMLRRGVDPFTQPLVFLGDGADWIWRRVRDLRNPSSTEILDFYHAAEHLSNTCKELYGEQTRPYKEHFRRWTKLLLRGKATIVIQDLYQIFTGTKYYIP